MSSNNRNANNVVDGDDAIYETTENTKCLHCLTPFRSEDNFHLIYDKLGKEMNLEKLLLVCYQIAVKPAADPDELQALCENCLTNLIDAFDKMEYARIKIVHSEAMEKLTQPVPNSELIIDRIDNEAAATDTEYIEFSENTNENQVFFEYEGENSSGIMYECLDEEEKAKDIDENLQFEEALTTDTHTNRGNAEIHQDLDSQGCSSTINEEESVGNDYEELVSIDYTDEGPNVDADADDPSTDSMQLYEEIDYLDEAEDIPLLRDYIQKSICSNFKDIAFPEPVECRLCKNKMFTHLNVIEHAIQKHAAIDTNSLFYSCVISDQCAPLKTKEEASLHFVFRHYDLETLAVYAQCLFCMKTFNNILIFNKHSCYKSGTMSRSTTECKKCGKCFQSNKRYRFHLQFHLEKHRLKACVICQIYIQDENELFDHLMYAHDPEDALICKLCDRNFINKDTYKAHTNVHHANRPFACNLCDKSYLNSQQLQDHMNSQHFQERVYNCTICKKQFFKPNILRKHLLKHKTKVIGAINSCELCGFLAEKEETVKEHIDVNHNDDKKYNIILINLLFACCCEYCEMAFNSVENLKIHRQIHTDKMYSCTICSMSFDQYRKAKIHKLTHPKHADQRKSFPVTRHYVCDIDGCTTNYNEWVALVSHKRNFHLIGKHRPFRCDICKEACVNRTELNLHLRAKHGKQTNFPCPFCEKEYKTPMAIAVHVARMHNNKKLACQECGTLCKNKEALNKHILNTHDILKCTICDKVLKNMKNLRTHIKMVHNKEKRYFCSFCDRGYFNNCDRITHEEAIHIKNKLFRCIVCPYTTPYKESFLVHEKNHTNIKPFQCNLCPKKFNRKYALTLHLRRHEDVRRFVCPFINCYSSYPNEGILKNHIKKKHSTVREISSSPVGTIETAQGFSEEAIEIDDFGSEYFVDDDNGDANSLLDDANGGDGNFDDDDIIVETLSNVDEDIDYVLDDDADDENVNDEQVAFNNVQIVKKISGTTKNGNNLNVASSYEVILDQYQT